MPNEKSYTGIIIKKQQLGDADELLTVYTENAGKMRFVATSVKRGSARLQQSLQSLFLVNLTTTGRGDLQKIIQVTVEQTFAYMRENSSSVHSAFWIAELLSKGTPDEEVNVSLFNSAKDALSALCQEGMNPSIVALRFGLSYLEVCGLTLLKSQGEKQWFSNQYGGFLDHAVSDGVVVTPECLDALKVIGSGTSEFTVQGDISKGLSELESLIYGFISYQLERKIHSSRFLGQ